MPSSRQQIQTSLFNIPGTSGPYDFFSKEPSSFISLIKHWFHLAFTRYVHGGNRFPEITCPTTGLCEPQWLHSWVSTHCRWKKIKKLTTWSLNSKPKGITFPQASLLEFWLIEKKKNFFKGKEKKPQGYLTWNLEILYFSNSLAGRKGREAFISQSYFSRLLLLIWHCCKIFQFVESMAEEF